MACGYVNYLCRLLNFVLFTSALPCPGSALLEILLWYTGCVAGRWFTAFEFLTKHFWCCNFALHSTSLEAVQTQADSVRMHDHNEAWCLHRSWEVTLPNLQLIFMLWWLSLITRSFGHPLADREVHWSCLQRAKSKGHTKSRSAYIIISSCLASPPAV